MARGLGRFLLVQALGASRRSRACGEGAARPAVRGRRYAGGHRLRTETDETPLRTVKYVLSRTLHTNDPDGVGSFHTRRCRHAAFRSGIKPHKKRELLPKHSALKKMENYENCSLAAVLEPA